MCSMRRSTLASKPANYERRSTDRCVAVRWRSSGRGSCPGAAPAWQQFLAARAPASQFRGGQHAHDADDLGGAAIAGLDTVVGLRDRHGPQAQSALAAALA